MARKAILPNLIIKLLQDTHLLSATQIVEYLHKAGGNFNKTSVYRALEKLHFNGDICKETFGETEVLYEVRGDHHDHAVCTSCEKIIKVPCVSHTQEIVEDFKVDHCHVTLYGLCNVCV
jgi:Fur family ferric uptake transcriptional regulator